jgi:hypothetical protein
VIPANLAIVASLVAQTTTTSTSTPSPSPTTGAGPGGIVTGAGLLVLAVLIGGMLLMRTRLLRR